MTGNSKDIGLYQRAGQDIFSFIEQNSHSKKTVVMSFFEIYCGKIFDLLNNRSKLEIREDAYQNIHIIGQTLKTVNNFQNMFDLICFGCNARTTSNTKKNNDSSRSHAILQIRIYEDGLPKGLLSFIDLAGNERGSDTYFHNAQTRIDGSEISKSLLALKECIRALNQEKSHIPFRGSKLTLLLKESFVGNCKTVMIANVSPNTSNCEYTLNTLRYADRVKYINKSSENESRRNISGVSINKGNISKKVLEKVKIIHKSEKKENVLQNNISVFGNFFTCKEESNRQTIDSLPMQFNPNFFFQEKMLQTVFLKEKYEQLIESAIDLEEDLIQSHQNHLKLIAHIAEEVFLVGNTVD